MNRIVNPAAIEAARHRDGVCLHGLILQDGCSSGIDVHHIDFKGAGGDDVLENLICLCRKHHNLAQARKIPASDLRRTLTRFYGYAYPVQNADLSDAGKWETK